MSIHRDMGVKHDDTSDMPAMESADEKRYPEMHLSGAQAEKYGVEGLKAGDKIKQEVVWRVKSINKSETDGQDPNHSVTLALESCTDPDVESDSESAGEGEDDSEPSSPALAYIEKHAAKD